MFFLNIINKGLLDNFSDVNLFDIGIIAQSLENLKKIKSQDFIERSYADLYFFKEEAIILDKLITWIKDSNYSDIQKNLLFLGFTQATLKKRPFHTFKSSYLQLRTKTRTQSQTWDQPILETFLTFIKGLNRFIEAVKGYNFNTISVSNINATNYTYSEFEKYTEKNLDLVYLDPPFISNKKKRSLKFTNYMKNYHVLESIANFYFRNNNDITNDDSSLNFIKDSYPPQKEMLNWLEIKTWLSSLETVIRNFENSSIILSYRDDSFIDEKSIIELLESYRRDVEVKRKPHVYNLANKESKFDDLLFIVRK